MKLTDSLSLLHGLNDASDGQRTVTLPHDAATFLYRNGERATASEVRPGDTVALAFASAAEARPSGDGAPLYPLAIRAFRLP